MSFAYDIKNGHPCTTHSPDVLGTGRSRDLTLENAHLADRKGEKGRAALLLLFYHNWWPLISHLSRGLRKNGVVSLKKKKYQKPKNKHKYEPHNT